MLSYLSLPNSAREYKRDPSPPVIFNIAEAWLGEIAN
jgi:hypothetical protein